jgi:hypothetical protein
MPDTLLSIFPNPDDLLSLPPEELGGVILEIASGVMQNGMFNMAGLLAPLFPPVGNGYPVGLRNEVRLTVAEALSWLTNEGLVMLDPDQPASWYRPTRRGAQLKTRADVDTFRKAEFREHRAEGPEDNTNPSEPGPDVTLGFEQAETPLPLRASRHPGGATAQAASEVFFQPRPPSVSEWHSPLSRTEPDDASLVAGLPDLPAQGPGPHFEITKTGIVDFAPPEALDREGNNVERLRRLHPTLRDLARQLVEALGTGNIPHAHLAARIAEYRKRVDQALDAIDFTLLYVEGLRLAS